MMSAWYILLFYVIVCLAEDAEPVVDHSKIQTTFGPIQGEVLEYPAGRLSRYLGIPYGRPPLGPLRFTSPQTPEPWTETLTTTAYPNRCYHNTFVDELFWIWNFHPEISEDCLYLNVYAPSSDVKQKKAVMLYIHGGGLILGAGSDTPLEALALAGDVITVSFNYRLDVFGFIATQDDRAPGNVGFLDQVLAMRWVKDNIAAFGGDPDKVTIFGISAGGWSVNAHMVSPLSRGLFTRAISQSGSMYGFPLETRQQRAERTRGLAASLGCPVSPEAVMLTCLQNVPADKLLGTAAQTDFMVLNSGPATAGGEFLPKQPGQLWDEHHIAPGVDYMLGACSEEGLISMILLPEDVRQAALDHGVSTQDPLFNLLLDFTSNWSPSHAHLTKLISERVKDQYLPDFGNKMGVLRGLLDAGADRMFLAPTIGAANKMAETDQKVYLYYLSQQPTTELNIVFPRFKGAPELEIGAHHGDDMFFIFAWPLVEGVPCSWATNMTEQDKALSRSMVHAWTNFAKTGEMTVLLDDSTEMKWPEYTTTLKTYLEWKYPMTSSAVKSRLLPRADGFWNVLLPPILQNQVQPHSPTNKKDEL